MQNEDYKRGYSQALEDINRPMKVKPEKWDVSECPRCKKPYYDYEICDDGYYQRAYGLDRYPYCGQKLEW